MIAGRIRRRAVLAMAALLLGGAAALNLAATPLSRMDLPWWRARFQAKQIELHSGPVALLWLGDSITQNWEQGNPDPFRDFKPVWDRFYGRRHAVNLGFMGDTTAHLLWRIENGETRGLHPKGAIVMIGANNFGKLRWGAGPTLAGIETIISALRKRLPETRILLIGVLPSIRNAWVDQNTAVVNAALAARFGKSDGAVSYIDLRNLFLTNGRVDAGKFLDGRLMPGSPSVHPSALTQAAMARAIEPAVQAMMGGR